jgi:hypothetical protein
MDLVTVQPVACAEPAYLGLNLALLGFEPRELPRAVRQRAQEADDQYPWCWAARRSGRPRCPAPGCRYWFGVIVTVRMSRYSAGSAGSTVHWVAPVPSTVPSLGSGLGEL